MKTLNRKLIFIIFLPLLLLCVPLIAMLISDEVNWTWFDFTVAGLLLFGFGVILELALRHFKQKRKRVVALIVLTIIFLLIWLELAVGIFGTPLAGS
ncbi:bacteriorhodopsin [Flavobacteriaceae bacterium GSB9]|nr:bacteriorhodopsin [Flavobacteriaceae bacterium GSB9]